MQSVLYLRYFYIFFDLLSLHISAKRAESAVISNFQVYPFEPHSYIPLTACPSGTFYLFKFGLKRVILYLALFRRMKSL